MVGWTEGCFVGVSIGKFVGCLVGYLVGIFVGIKVGNSVGGCVGTLTVVFPEINQISLSICPYPAAAIKTGNN